MSERSVTNCRWSRTVRRRMLPTNCRSTQLVGQDPFLGVVELIGKTVGKAVERLDHLSGNHLKQGGGRLHLEPPAQFLAGCLDGVQLMPAARDEHALGQSKMQKADLLSGTA
ncbi:MAG: hypothetical protein WA453_01590 [Methyloceanibacter sp.]